jgi:UDP-glucuronate 4-epimerase
LALFKFVDAILDDRPIDIYNHGEMYRDFTYVDDLVRGIRLLIDTVPERPARPRGDRLPRRQPVARGALPDRQYRQLRQGAASGFRGGHRGASARPAIRNYMPMQKGDVPATWADTSLLQRLTGYRPQTDFRDGIDRFVAWFRDDASAQGGGPGEARAAGGLSTPYQAFRARRLHDRQHARREGAA